MLHSFLYYNIRQILQQQSKVSALASAAWARESLASLVNVSYKASYFVVPFCVAASGAYANVEVVKTEQFDNTPVSAQSESIQTVANNTITHQADTEIDPSDSKHAKDLNDLKQTDRALTETEAVLASIPPTAQSVDVQSSEANLTDPALLDPLLEKPPLDSQSLVAPQSLEKSVSSTPTNTKKASHASDSLKRLEALYQNRYQDQHFMTALGNQGDNNLSMPSTPAKVCEGHWQNGSSLKPNLSSHNLLSQTGLSETKPDPNFAGIHALADYGYYDNQKYAQLSGNVVLTQGNQTLQSDQAQVNLETGEARVFGKVSFVDLPDQTQANQNADQRPDQSDHPPSVQNADLMTNDLPKASPSRLQQAKFGGLIGMADSLDYQANNNKIAAQDVAFASLDMQAHGHAQRMEKLDAGQYQLDKVMLSMCPPTDRKWQLEAQKIQLDTDTGRGVAHHTTLKIADTPIFYLPYFDFPIDGRRASGFLLPKAGIDSQNGLEVEVPYYLNLAPNFDATLTSRIFSQRNPMVKGELRYLTQDFGYGELMGSFLPKDRKYDDQNRSSLIFNHHWQSKTMDHLTADIKYNRVSDADYLNDFDQIDGVSNPLNLPRYVKANYRNDYVDGELRFETFQTMQAYDSFGQRIPDKDKPYARLPQLHLEYRLPKLSDWLAGKQNPQNQPSLSRLFPHSASFLDRLEITGISDGAYFKKSIHDGSQVEKSGVRVYNKLEARYPLDYAWGYVHPSVGLQHLFTAYDENSRLVNHLSKEEGKKSVFVPQAALDMGLYFYRSGSPFAGLSSDWFNFIKPKKSNPSVNLSDRESDKKSVYQGYQLLSPRLKYVYSPYKDQNDLLNFNTRIASVNYQQLFADSWFLGYDRLQDLHAVTPALNYRYVDGTGRTRFDASIGEQFYLTDSKVGLSQNRDLFSQKSSGLVWESSVQPYDNLGFNISGALTPNYDLNFLTTQINYQPSRQSFINLGFVKRQQNSNTNQLPLTAYTAGVAFPIHKNWQILAHGQYDDRSDTLLDATLGLDYEDCCLGFSIYGRRYLNDLNLKEEPTQAIMAELRLKGLSNEQSRLSRHFADKVSGFYDKNPKWQD